jgi:hypothetical protein
MVFQGLLKYYALFAMCLGSISAINNFRIVATRFVLNLLLQIHV